MLNEKCLSRQTTGKLCEKFIIYFCSHLLLLYLFLTRTELDLQTEGITARIYTYFYLLRITILGMICDFVCLQIEPITHLPCLFVLFRTLPDYSVNFWTLLRSSRSSNHFPSRNRLIA